MDSVGRSPLSLDDELRLLADWRRRMILLRLKERDDNAVSVDELVAELNAVVQSTERGDLKVELLHLHLPKLAEHGVIALDAERGAVVYQGNDRIEQLLEVCPSPGAN